MPRLAGEGLGRLGKGWAALGRLGEAREALGRLGRSTITVDFTVPQKAHKYSRADGMKRKHPLYSSKCPRLDNPPIRSQLSKSRWYFKKPSPLPQQLSSTPQSHDKLTIVQEQMVFKNHLLYSSNCPRLHSPPTSSLLFKSRW